MEKAEKTAVCQNDSIHINHQNQFAKTTTIANQQPDTVNLQQDKARFCGQVVHINALLQERNIRIETQELFN